MRTRAWLGLAAALLGSGCATDPMGRESALEDAQLRYTQHVRWGDLDAASRYVDPAQREAFLRAAPALSAIRITDYEIGPIAYGEGRQSATVRVTYHAYSLDSAQERRIDEEQRWVRPGRGNTWWVTPQLASLAAPFEKAGR